jgi:hypothetical protein
MNATPGSGAAKDAGCLCPVLDNAHGRGAYVDEHGAPQFWIVEGCPLHALGSAVSVDAVAVPDTPKVEDTGEETTT